MDTSNHLPKVLHIITRLDPGGSATNTIISVDLLRKHGFHTVLAFGVTNDPENSIINNLKERNISFYRLPNMVRNPSPIKDLLALKNIQKLLEKEKFDLVHTHSSKAGVLGRIAAKNARCTAEPQGLDVGAQQRARLRAIINK